MLLLSFIQMTFFQMILSVVLWTIITAGGTGIKINLHSTTLLRCLMNLTHAKKVCGDSWEKDIWQDSYMMQIYFYTMLHVFVKKNSYLKSLEST